MRPFFRRLRQWWTNPIPTKPDPDPPSPPDPPDLPGDDDLLSEINRFRMRHGKKPLERSGCLDRQSQNHAEHMARTRNMSHQGFYERLRACSKSSGSENVAYGQQNAEQCVVSWANSHSHRTNMLGDWDECGTGDQGGYWCALFSR